MNIEAIGDRMVIEPYKVVETSSGVMRIDAGHSTPVRGVVVSAGKRHWFRKGSRFKSGEEVFFRRYSVDELKVPQADGTEKSVFICEDADIVARIIK